MEPEAERIARIGETLRHLPGVAGIVLGGSRARGTGSPDSDYDIGVYYTADDELDISALAGAAKALDDERRDGLIAPPGAWGNWVNGGGWLTVGGMPVDIILRDIARVRQAVDDCRAGVVHAHYQTGHPHAYVNIMYAGELAIAAILRDDDGILRDLQQKTAPYPKRLQEAVVRYFGFEAGFSRMLAEANAGKDDDYYVAAHIVRSLSCLNQVLFAANGEYCINEKKAVRMIGDFPHAPAEYGNRVQKILSLSGNDNAEACRELEALVDDAMRIATSNA